MARSTGALLRTAILSQLLHSILAGHPCTEEVASACSERPGTEIGACLKDPEEHDAPTEISSACTDFIALNKACADDIEQFCDAGHFTDDTIICLTKWTPQDNLSPKCQGVLSWAVPQADAEASKEQVVTDELGMSDEDYKEKKEWQKKRAAARGEAIERMKMKETDKKKEEDRVALEEFKKNDPEGYAAMLQQQEEEKRQQAEFKKKERARAAAIERAQRKAEGKSEDGDDADTRKKEASGKKAEKSKGSWLYSVMSFAFIGLLIALLYYLVVNASNSKGSKGARKEKKKRG